MKPASRILPAGIVFLAMLCASPLAFASAIIPLTTSQHVAASAAVFRGTVVGQSSFRDSDGLIYTTTSLRVDEPLLGTFPDVLKVVHRGGQVGNEDEYFGLSPRFVNGGEYLVFVTRRPDGRLQCTQGYASAIPLERASEVSAGGKAFNSPAEQLLSEVRSLILQNQSSGSDVIDQADFGGITTSATTGMLQGLNTRFVQPDCGNPILYLIDADSLPVGITLAQATNAVQQALNAWAAVTSLRFKLEEIVSFGQGADTISAQDEKLRIQLHDNYNSIITPSTLGIGGRASLSSPLPSGWDLGGNVAGNEFHKTGHGFVVLKASNASLQVVSTFTEVLCHEIGHALNMAHSSEVATNNSTLTNSIMYFQAHKDGRGATLGVYDPPIIQQCYPSNNTPPYAFASSRMMDVTTASPQPNVNGINSVDLRGVDLQSANLTLIITNGTANYGTFSGSATVLKYSPTIVGNGPRSDPAGNSQYDYIFARLSDGTNASAYTLVRVLSLSSDSYPTPSDGIPDNWMIAQWGNANPAAGPNRGAQQDWDGDKMKNIDEYRSGMNPLLPSSGQRVTLITASNLEFQAKAYELYELQASTNMTNWVRAAHPVVPTTSIGTFTGFTNNAPHLFFRVEKVP